MTSADVSSKWILVFTGTWISFAVTTPRPGYDASHHQSCPTTLTTRARSEGWRIALLVVIVRTPRTKRMSAGAITPPIQMNLSSLNRARTGRSPRPCTIAHTISVATTTYTTTARPNMTHHSRVTSCDSLPAVCRLDGDAPPHAASAS